VGVFRTASAGFAAVLACTALMSPAAMASSVPAATVAATGVRTDWCGHWGEPGSAEGTDPYQSFFPSLQANVAGGLRAVVFVVPGTPKGTSRSAQEYESPLLVFSGAEYSSSSFTALHTKLCDALRAGQPKLVAEILRADGSCSLLFEDGAVLKVAGRQRSDN